MVLDGFIIGRISGRLTSYLDEVYPTIFEVVTSEIDRRGGNIRKFERDIEKSNRKIDVGEQHPNFLSVLFEAMRFVDWRILLQAFRQSEWQNGIALLDAQSDYGKSIFAALVNSMKQDENKIENRLRLYMQLGYRNRC